MKNLYPLIAFLFFNIITSQEVMHINFDDINPDVTFESWNNSSTFSLTTNPMPDPVNASNNVGQLTAGSDEGGNFDSNIGKEY